MIMIDIEMPEKCGECPCFHADHPMHCQLIKPPDKNKRLSAPYGLPRPDWCPLKKQETKHGEWLESKILEDCFWVCSECEFQSEAFAAPMLYKYCPNCGVKMDRR